MLAKKITFTDYNGQERTETHYFNLEKNEILEMDISQTGGLLEGVKRIIEARNGKEIMRIFKDIILKSYGEKDLDGVHFVKSEELSRRFMQSKAYDELFMELVTDDEAAANFINGIIPEGFNVDESEVDKLKDELNINVPSKTEA